MEPTLISNTEFIGFSQEEAAAALGPCDAGPCELIPGLVYNAETNQCSWPDEAGCSLAGMACLYYKLI